MVFVIPWFQAMESLWFLYALESRQWKTYGFCEPLAEGNRKPMVFCSTPDPSHGKPMVSVVPWPKVFHRIGIAKNELIPYGSAYGSDQRPG